MRRAVLAPVGIALVAALAQAAAAEADVVWLCKPGAADNPCEIQQDTTIREAGQPDRVVTPPEGPRDVDCFYVYPTVSNQPTPNANKSRDPELESIAKYQAARFSLQCRVFAPTIARRRSPPSPPGRSARQVPTASSHTRTCWRRGGNT